ncbi:MAG: sporulation YhaL family protein [Caldibacillus sp.]
MVPWWVYLIVAGIVFSAYMTIRTSREESAHDEEEIAKFGTAFRTRLADQPEKSKQNQYSN